MKTIRFKTSPATLVLLFGMLLIATASARAQLIFSFDTGLQSTKYGSGTQTTYGDGHGKVTYTQGPNTVGFADVGVGFLFAGHSGRKYGYNSYAIGDVSFPFNADSTSGGVFGGGGAVGENFRIHQASMGLGFDIHDYGFSNDSGAGYPLRPTELLVGVPVMAKYSFGPGARAYVQGGAVVYVASAPGTYQAGNSSSNSTLTGLDLELKGGKSADYKVAGGYTFGHWGVRASYLIRDLYFNPAGVPDASSVPYNFFDVHQQNVSAGVTYTHF